MVFTVCFELAENGHSSLAAFGAGVEDKRITTVGDFVDLRWCNNFAFCHFIVVNRAVHGGKYYLVAFYEAVYAAKVCGVVMRGDDQIAVPGRAKLAAGGKAELAIGTHALLSQTTEFARLGMVITDEQHRFGVAQRAALSEKGRGAHLLVMSATPIPRTLALILYGDLDVSILDELPPGRQRTDTFLVNETYRARLNGFLRKEVQAGHQCYVVCPSVEEGETESGKAAQVWAETLRQRVFPDLQVGLLHGRMKGQEKEAAMAELAQGKTQILVATTVIEVGVDVPNATVMVVEDADRFGLSQLHQLRGRVGRGPAKSYCILLSNNRNPDTQARLKALCKTGDGFRIAEEDLQLRGPGDFFGHRQHGLPTFRAANLSMDVSLLQQAQAAAALWIDRHGDADTPEAACLRARVESLFRDGSVAWN